MTRQVLAPDQAGAVFSSVQHSLFRLELQPEYNVGRGLAKVAAFTAGAPEDPGADAGFMAWCDRVREWRAAGVRVERVRVQADVPTDYQRWERWVGAWNIEAGEILRYMSRTEAHACGLLPAAGAVDWWLVDSRRVLQTTYTPDYQIDEQVLDDTPDVVVQACAWRDLTVHYSHLENLQGIALQGLRR